jgi:hypothetical protein
MTALQTVWQQLLQRRLLPLAILLVAALVAVPLLLTRDAKPTPPVPAPKADAGESTASAGVAKPIVDLVQNGERTKRRRVLGARKNPFAPAPAPKVKAAAGGSQPVTGLPGGAQPGGIGTSTPDATTVSGGTSTPPAISVGGGGAPPVATSPSPPQAPKPHYELYSLTVRFGDSTSDSLDKMTLNRLKPLPDGDDPILVYLGVTKDKKSAVFMVDTSVSAQGDGTCKPAPGDCETIELREGETEFFDVVDANGNVTDQFELDLVKIHRSTTASAAVAKAAGAKAGRRALHAREAKAGPLRWRYDVKSGTLRKLGAKAWKAAVAKAAKALKAHL